MENLILWRETYERSMELADVSFTVLNVVMDYCKAKNIPLYQEENIWNLVRKAQSLFKEIESLNSSMFNTQNLLADEKKHLNGTDEDETESIAPLYKL